MNCAMAISAGNNFFVSFFSCELFFYSFVFVCCLRNKMVLAFFSRFSSAEHTFKYILCHFFFLIYGRGEGTRTPNRRFWKPELYQLSHTPVLINEVHSFPLYDKDNCIA